MLTSLARIVSLQHSPSGTVSRFEVQPQDADQRDFASGQFVMIERIDGVLAANGRPLKRAYSIASTPDDLKHQGIIAFYVKQASESGLSHYLTQQIRIGDEIKITGPVGHFVDPHLCQRYLLLSTGSGLTPILSHYRTLSHRDGVRIAHLYGERHQDMLISSIVDQRQSTDHIWHYLTLSQGQKPGRNSGYVQHGLEGALHRLGGTDIVAMLCGKPAMVDEVRALLIEYGVSPERVLFEKY